MWVNSSSMMPLTISGLLQYLITSLDDYGSRFILCGIHRTRDLIGSLRVSSRSSYDTGSPSRTTLTPTLFSRFVRGRDAFWQNTSVLPMRLPRNGSRYSMIAMKVTYALSLRQRGRLNDLYGWLQDRLIRTCVRENITEIHAAQEILRHEVTGTSNYHQIHSTTLEVLLVRFQNALSEKKSPFREFSVKPPFESLKDIFSACIERNCRCLLLADAFSSSQPSDNRP